MRSDGTGIGSDLRSQWTKDGVIYVFKITSGKESKDKIHDMMCTNKKK